jgi:hypothetical protein
LKWSLLRREKKINSPSGVSGVNLRSWYSDELRLKVARPVTEGRANAVRAAELHRLMTELLEADHRSHA